MRMLYRKMRFCTTRVEGDVKSQEPYFLCVWDFDTALLGYKTVFPTYIKRLKIIIIIFFLTRQWSIGM